MGKRYEDHAVAGREERNRRHRTAHIGVMVKVALAMISTIKGVFQANRSGLIEVVWDETYLSRPTVDSEG